MQNAPLPIDCRYADRILYSTTFQPISYEDIVTGNNVTSDHRPVALKLAIKNENAITTALVVTYNCNARFDQGFFEKIVKAEETIIIVHVQEVSKNVYQELQKVFKSAMFVGNMECAANLDFGLASFYKFHNSLRHFGRCIPANTKGVVKSFISRVVKTKGYVENVIYFHGLRISCFNVHAPFVNEPALLQFYKQLDQAVKKAENVHKGCVILAGDFNSRSSVNGARGAPIPYQKDVGIFATECTPTPQQ